MAMAQAEWVASLLEGVGIATRVVGLTTSGDRWSGDLSDLGGKGAFVKEIDRALLDERADLAVHCLKDIPGDEPIPDGLEIAAYLAREAVQDAVVAPVGTALPSGPDSLPAGAVVGTSSVRRRAQLQRRWPHLVLRPIRGNANSRLARLDAGEYDALILATAGLRRIGQEDRITAELSTTDMLPAIGAGQLVVTARAKDARSIALAARHDDGLSRACAEAERALLAALHGHCNSPIAGHARAVAAGTLELRAAVYALDGSRILEATATGPTSSPEELGRTVASDLHAQGAAELITQSAPTS